MSSVLRHFEMLIAREWSDEYKSQYHVMSMGLRRDGTIVYSSNGAAVFPPAERLVVKVAHAEQRLARKLDKGAEVYVVRLTRDGEMALARPCPSCQTVLKARGVRRVCYSIGPREFGVLKF